MIERRKYPNRTGISLENAWAAYIRDMNVHHMNEERDYLNWWGLLYR